MELHIMATNAQVLRYFDVTPTRDPQEMRDALADYGRPNGGAAGTLKRSLTTYIRTLNQRAQSPYTLPAAPVAPRTRTAPAPAPAPAPRRFRRARNTAPSGPGTTRVRNDEHSSAEIFAAAAVIVGLLIAAALYFGLRSQKSTASASSNSDSSAQVYDRGSDNNDGDTDDGNDADNNDGDTDDKGKANDKGKDNNDELEASDGGMINLLSDGRSTNARQSINVVSSLSPDCPPYRDTGVNSTPRTFNCTIAKGAVVISGGVSSKNLGVDNGFLVATAGPTTWSDTIVDGFYTIKSSAAAEAEWCTRIQQANAPENNWLSSQVKVLPGWNGCSKQVIAQLKANAASSGSGQSKANDGGSASSGDAPCTGKNEPTGVNVEKSFTKGTCVDGVTITLDNGDVKHNCYFLSAPASGKVKTGVFYPNQAELNRSKPC